MEIKKTSLITEDSKFNTEVFDNEVKGRPV